MITNELGIGIKAKREDVLSQFVKLSRSWIQDRAFNMLGNWQDAEEATNDVYLHILKKIDTWDPKKGTFYSWVNIVIRNNLVDISRKRMSVNKKHPVLLAEDDLYLIENVSTGENVLNELVYTSENRNALVKIENALEKVRLPHWRICWILRYLEGYKSTEVATILNLPLGTVKGSVHRCKKELRRLLKTSQLTIGDYITEVK